MTQAESQYEPAYDIVTLMLGHHWLALDKLADRFIEGGNADILIESLADCCLELLEAMAQQQGIEPEDAWRRFLLIKGAQQ